MPNPNVLEQAVSRTLRDSLQKLQLTTEELDHAINDLVSACASTRPSNALSPILRAQTAASSLAASLEVLSRFVIGSLQPAPGGPAPVAIKESEQQPEPAREMNSLPAATAVSESPIEPPSQETVTDLVASNMAEQDAPVSASAPAQVESVPEINTSSQPEIAQTPELPEVAQESDEPSPDAQLSLDQVQPLDQPLPLDQESARDQELSQELIPELMPQVAAASATSENNDSYQPLEPPPPAREAFDVTALVPEQRELHRRADRVAKVAMQDIKMLRPDQVSLGRERKDLCSRLSDDIERARKEYDRRFQSIQAHPVDYFYNRMVEILGDGDPAALGEYPYPSPMLRR